MLATAYAQVAQANQHTHTSKRAVSQSFEAETAPKLTETAPNAKNDKNSSRYASSDARNSSLNSFGLPLPRLAFMH